MNEEKFIILTTLSYLIVSIVIYLGFFLIIIFNPKWQFRNRSRDLFQRYFKQTSTKNIHSGNTESACSHIILNDNLNSSISSSDFILESESILLRTIRSFGLFLCTCLFLTNWLRLIFYIFPRFYPNLLRYSSNLCILQSFFLHVLTLFHLILTISIRLFWHYCFLVSKYWQTITYRRLISYLLCIFICLCIFTWPSISDEWASIIFDRILNLCIVNYRFHLSYTFFVLSFTCIIPLLLLIFSHYTQMKCIQRRITKYVSVLTIDQQKRKVDIIHYKNQFEFTSYITLVWVILNIILLICIHIPMEDGYLIKSIGYYVQMFAFIFDPILYIFIFRSLAIITLLRPTNELYFKKKNIY